MHAHAHMHMALPVLLLDLHPDLATSDQNALLLSSSPELILTLILLWFFSFRQQKCLNCLGKGFV